MSTEHEIELLHLVPWSEVTGTYHGSQVDGHHIYVRIGKRAVAFAVESREASLVRRRLSENMVGRKIGILKTNLPDKPLLFRVVSQQSARLKPGRVLVNGS